MTNAFPTTVTKRVPMDSVRKTAFVAGALYLITFITAIPAVFLLEPVLKHPDYIVSSGADTQVLFGGLLDLVNAFACIGTAVSLFPVVKRQNEGVALGFVTARVMEAAIIVIGVVSLLSIVTLRQAGPAGADAASLVTAGRALVAIRDWTFLLGPSLMPGGERIVAGLPDVPVGPRAPPHSGPGTHRSPPDHLVHDRNHVRRQRAGVRVAGHRDRPDLPVGAVARRMAGRQGLQALCIGRTWCRLSECRGVGAARRIASRSSSTLVACAPSSRLLHNLMSRSRP